MTDETGDSQVDGVTWFSDKIYVVCRGSNRVHVFQDQEPYTEMKEEEIKIKEMIQPMDITASKVSRSVFISDRDKKCLFKVCMPGGGISRHGMDGNPGRLSTTSADELIVVLQLDGQHYSLDIFDCLNVNRTQSIPLSTKIHQVLHAVQSSNGNIILSHSTKNSPDVYQISEMSIDGRNFIRTFDPRSVQSISIRNWKPGHLAFHDDDYLFVVDWERSGVYLLSPRLTDLEIMLKHYQYRLNGPHRLCYVREKQQLIVGQTGMIGEPGLVSVFCVLKSGVHRN